jgi:hypothetical protein
MPTVSTRFAALACAAVLSAAVAAPAFAGPPWISIEMPVNPYNSQTRDAFCLVRVYHHGDAAYYPLNGTAEGLVNGERRTVKLDIHETDTPGLWAVRYQPATEGTWLLVLRVGTDEDHGSATVLVSIGRGGAITAARVPTHRQGSYLLPSQVTAQDVDAALRAQG